MTTESHHSQRIEERVLRDLSRAALRSMKWSLEATRWWTETLVETPRTIVQPDSALLTELVAGVGRAFRGRTFAMELGGRRVRALLNSIALDRRTDGYGARAELRSVECDGLAIESLSIIAADVGLTPPPGVVLIASAIELRGRSQLESLVAWLNLALSDWNLEPSDNGLIEAVRRSGGSARFLVKASVRNDELEADIRALRWRSIALRVPRWLRLSRRLELPALADGLSVVEAHHEGGRVDFRLSLRSLAHAFEPEALRAEIARLTYQR